MNPCPICKRSAAPRSENASAPFCSPRCKTIDLGKWLTADYRVATDEAPSLESSESEEPTS